MPDSDTSERILTAATQLFLSQGYGSTNLDQVAKRAGVTKPTVYSHFGSKHGLLCAMTQRHTDTRVLEFKSNLVSAGDPQAELTRFAEAFLKRVLSDEARAWQRLGTAESDRYPEVGEAFYNAGPRRVFEFITEYLQGEKRAGRLSFPNAERAAEQFLGMLLGIDLLRSLVGQPLPSAAWRKKRCRETVAVFLSAYATEQTARDTGLTSESLR